MLYEELQNSYQNFCFTSLGSASILMIAVSMASWFSSLEALAASKTIMSLSMPSLKTYRMILWHSDTWQRYKKQALNKPTFLHAMSYIQLIPDS